MYEIGALRALDEAIDGLDVNALDVYVGVSAGAFVAANLVNQLSTAQMCRAIVKHEPGEHPFVPETFFTPALLEWTRRGLSVPRLALEAIWEFARHPRDLTLMESFTRLGHALPVGIFDNEPIRHYLRNIYTMKGRTDDFRELERRLYIVAAELESGRSVVFGKPGRDHVAISRAVQASSALPGLYSPVEIDGHLYVDGVLNRTVHASVALDAGAKLLFCINPIVPVDVSTDNAAGQYAEGELLRRGLPSVLDQTFRTLIHSRLEVGMKRYDKLYEDSGRHPSRAGSRRLRDLLQQHLQLLGAQRRLRACLRLDAARPPQPLRPAGADPRAARPEAAARHPGGPLARALAGSRTRQLGRREARPQRRAPRIEP